MDRFRKNYTPIDDKQKELVATIKSAAEELERVFQEVLRYSNAVSGSSPDVGRAMAVATTKLQEVVFWAVYGVTSNLKPTE